MGQTQIAQAKGGMHVLHALMGLSGACPDFSLRANESSESFGAAVQVRLSRRAILQVRMLYSDYPAEGMLKYLPNALGVAEDSIHFKIRAGGCFGEKDTACTYGILQLHNKFGCVLPGPDEAIVRQIYRRDEKAGVDWDSLAFAAERSETDWAEYCKLAFASREEYVRAEAHRAEV